MVSMTVFTDAERAREAKRSKVRRLVPATPPLSYRLQNVIYVSDRGYGAAPRYAIEFEDADGGWSGIEFETNDSVEVLRRASELAGDDFKNRRYGVRIEFLGPYDLARIQRMAEGYK